MTRILVGHQVVLAIHQSRSALGREASHTLLTEAFYSARIGRWEPDPDAYTRALAATGASPDRGLFVDDRLDNCHTARELGMRALHFTTDTALLTRIPILQDPHAAG